MDRENGEDIRAISLKRLTHSARTKLCLLNSNKVIPTEGPEKLPRDWRGLAALLNISSETTSGLHNAEIDKVTKLLTLWFQKNDDTATLGTLFGYLERLDRFDVLDELIDLEKLGQLVVEKGTSTDENSFQLDDLRDDLITSDDVRHGCPQKYHAYVLYAKQDQEFVSEIMERMGNLGFKLCTEENLLPGYATQYAPIAQLISKRCYRIILVYSPDFLNSPANSFYMDYAQAVSIETKTPRIIPCMYRQCELPANLTFYHTLYYNHPHNQKSIYQFWEKLAETLVLVKMAEGETPAASHQINTTEFETFRKAQSMSQNKNRKKSTISTSTKTSNLDLTTETQSLSNLTLKEKRKHKFTTVRNFFNSLKGKKQKNAIMVEN